MPDFALAAPAAGDFSPLGLFLQADIVVKAVMVGLLIASIWVWTIILVHGLRLSRLQKASRRFEADFWRAADIDRFFDDHGRAPGASPAVLQAGMTEWRRSTVSDKVDRDGARDRLGIALHGAVADEVDRLGDRLNMLATVGSVAPFVGLFGTVWGIMRSFTAIAAEQNSSLAVVAPGIAEALFATAIGLFAAIPAVIGYNRLSHRLNRIEASLGRFADGLHATFSRELDAG